MLEYKLTPHHAGIALWGDFATLDRLHEFIHHVVEECACIEDKEGFVLGLAYDVRKAFQGQRSQGYRVFSEDERVVSPRSPDQRLSLRGRQVQPFSLGTIQRISGAILALFSASLHPLRSAFFLR